MEVGECGKLLSLNQVPSITNSGSEVCGSRSDCPWGGPTVRSIDKTIISIKTPHAVISRKMGILNARSVCNKALAIMNLVLDNDLDILAITETWLRNGDTATPAELKPPGYEFHHTTHEAMGRPV